MKTNSAKVSEKSPHSKWQLISPFEIYSLSSSLWKNLPSFLPYNLYTKTFISLSSEIIFYEARQ